MSLFYVQCQRDITPLCHQFCFHQAVLYKASKTALPVPFPQGNEAILMN